MPTLRQNLSRSAAPLVLRKPIKKTKKSQSPLRDKAVSAPLPGSVPRSCTTRCLSPPTPPPPPHCRHAPTAPALRTAPVGGLGGGVKPGLAPAEGPFRTLLHKRRKEPDAGRGCHRARTLTYPSLYYAEVARSLCSPRAFLLFFFCSTRVQKVQRRVPTGSAAEPRPARCANIEAAPLVLRKTAKMKTKESQSPLREKAVSAPLPGSVPRSCTTRCLSKRSASHPPHCRHAATAPALRTVPVGGGEAGLPPLKDHFFVSARKNRMRDGGATEHGAPTYPSLYYAEAARSPLQSSRLFCYCFVIFFSVVQEYRKYNVES